MFFVSSQEIWFPCRPSPPRVFMPRLSRKKTVTDFSCGDISPSPSFRLTFFSPRRLAEDASLANFYPCNMPDGRRELLSFVPPHLTNLREIFFLPFVSFPPIEPDFSNRSPLTFLIVPCFRIFPPCPYFFSFPSSWFSAACDLVRKVVL